ncbi:hypothetical protein BC374_12775 [Ensifer sp. LC13]|nr:hypothetical protein BC362_02735 [Ensifer sp. LC14]OCP13705.1 hypothetical protein BC374_12775 [Ensifer sp. LC13]OCP14362.1 hypothetical protein BBX50_13060 [Ensifer sp. LC11]OCP29068.1 hypothetical protein BC364_11175 [Ensifer sp. LC499]
MKFLRRAGIVGLLSFAFATAARADGDAFAGQWRQLTSTAGRCDKCYIGIVRHGDLLTVSSNTGWQAVANVEGFADLQLAAGKGQWKPTISGAYGGRSFGIQFVRRGGQLQMFMVVSQADGAPLSIRVTFEKGLPSNRHQELPAETHRI